MPERLDESSIEEWGSQNEADSLQSWADVKPAEALTVALRLNRGLRRHIFQRFSSI